MQVLITIQDDSKALKFLEFLKELSFLEIQKLPSEEKSTFQNPKLPSEFYKPIKVEKFTKLDRNEIYAEILH